MNGRTGTPGGWMGPRKKFKMPNTITSIRVFYDINNDVKSIGPSLLDIHFNDTDPSSFIDMSKIHLGILNYTLLMTNTQIGLE